MDGQEIIQPFGSPPALMTNHTGELQLSPPIALPPISAAHLDGTKPQNLGDLDLVLIPPLLGRPDWPPHGPSIQGSLLQAEDPY